MEYQAGSGGEGSKSLLIPGESLEKTIGAGGADSWFVKLEAEDLAKVRIETRDLSTIATIYSPGGASLRRFPGDGAEIRDIYFVARENGYYRIEVRASEAAVADRFLIRLERVTSIEERMTPPRLQESKLLSDLRAGLLINQEGALREFWNAIEKTGTPVFESIEEEFEFTLCTFVYRGDENTRCVLVSIPPYSRIAKEKFMMANLDGTDVWYTTVVLPARSRFLYSLVINTPDLNAGPGSSHEEIEIVRAASLADPLNPRRMQRADGAVSLDFRSIFEPPDACPQPWVERRPTSRPGTVERFVLRSVALENERTVTIYSPPGAGRRSEPLPLLILFDESVYLREIKADVILDNLIEAGQIPPMLAVFVGAPPGSRGRELACNPRFSAFVAGELLDWIASRCNVARLPERIILGGASLGGLAAAFTALQYPERFGNVLSQSGSFYWRPPEQSRNGAGPSAIVALALVKSPAGIRFYLEAGTDEIELPGRGLGILNANRNLRDVLYAKGYDVTYREFAGGHGAVNWRGGFADGLIALARSRRVRESLDKS